VLVRFNVEIKAVWTDCQVAHTSNIFVNPLKQMVKNRNGEVHHKL